jgi:hypothetical protein
VGAAAATAAVVQSPGTWSIVQEVARLWLDKCSDQERAWVPRRGSSWLGLMHEVDLLWHAVVFGRSHARIALSEDGSRATKIRGVGHRVAASKVVMRAGRQGGVAVQGVRGL